MVSPPSAAAFTLLTHPPSYFPWTRRGAIDNLLVIPIAIAIACAASILPLALEGETRITDQRPGAVFDAAFSPTADILLCEPICAICPLVAGATGGQPREQIDGSDTLEGSGSGLFRWRCDGPRFRAVDSTKVTEEPATWERYAIANHATPAVVHAIRDATTFYAQEHDIDATRLATDLTAVLMRESNLQHESDTGIVKRGDSGKAIGIGQLWPVWEKHFGYDRESLYWNIWMAAGVLMYSDWETDRRRALGKYNGGPKPNYRYADAVIAIVAAMRWE